MRPTEDDLFRDYVSDRRIERDLEREPRRLHRHPLCVVPAPVAAHAVADTAIVTIPCPSCQAGVFVPADSNLERVDCYDCEAQLVTRRDVAHVLSLAVVESGGAP